MKGTFTTERGRAVADSEVFVPEKAQEGIKRALDAFAELELTVAEATHAVICLNASFKANYPEVYRLMSKGRGAEQPVIDVEPAE